MLIFEICVISDATLELEQGQNMETSDELVNYVLKIYKKKYQTNSAFLIYEAVKI